ncbi:MAG: hypothetical protein JNJ71_11320 [Rubrivivax sp.]|nr:hypothetical protein [Rubrivivax sp.]
MPPGPGSGPQAGAAPRSKARRPKGSALERWTVIVLRSLHLAGVVWVGAAVLRGETASVLAAGLMALTGLAMLMLDLRARRLALRELAGIFVLLKLILVGWMVLDPRQAMWIFWVLLIASSITSHAPKGFRHWPTPPP